MHSLWECIGNQNIATEILHGCDTEEWWFKDVVSLWGTPNNTAIIIVRDHDLGRQ